MKSVEKVKRVLEKQRYSVVGNHSGVQICRWTKNSLNGKGVCWKEKFYGIKSHRCCEFSPSIMWCENSCVHCWRPIEMNLGGKIEGEIDEPKKILEGIIEARKKLLMGFKGNKNVSEKKFKEACEPNMFTLSLSGEPTLYPYLPGLIREIRNRKAICFLVTNGLNPEVLSKLEEENALPTQLTISLNAPNRKLFDMWHNSKKKDAWEKFNESLTVMKVLERKTRRVIRLTLAKEGKEPKNKLNALSNMTEENVKEYADMINKANPDYVHIKGFMSVGWARERMGYDKMPWHYEVKRYAERILEELRKKNKEWKILGEEKRSCVILLGKTSKGLRIKI